MTQARTNLARIILASIVALLWGFAFAPRTLALEEGSHLHFGILNYDPTVPSADYTYRIRLEAHGQAGATGSAWIDVNDWDQAKPFRVNGGARTTRYSFPVSKLLAGPVYLSVTVPFAEWACGRHEIRFRLNLNTNFEGKRQFTTSRTMTSVAGCSTDRAHGRPSNWLGGGGGWYAGTEYSIGIQQTPFANLRAGASTSWRVQSNANRGCLFKNPNAHAGSMGTALGPCWIGTSSVTRTLPSSVVPGDRIMLYSEDTTPRKQHGGPYVVWVPAAGATTYRVEYQDWWQSSGLSVP